jgi:5-methylcytosine-specific restriction protein B
MSRYCGDADPEPKLEAAEHWKKECLLRDGSVFSGESLWRLDHLESLDRYYVNNPDDTERTFLDKLREQLAPTPPAVKELVAEMLWVMLLCPSNIGVGKKLEDVKQVWSWSGQALPEDSRWLSAKVLKGVGSTGQSYNYNRWRELVFRSAYVGAETTGRFTAAAVACGWMVIRKVDRGSPGRGLASVAPHRL